MSNIKTNHRTAEFFPYGDFYKHLLFVRSLFIVLRGNADVFLEYRRKIHRVGKSGEDGYVFYRIYAVIEERNGKFYPKRAQIFRICRSRFFLEDMREIFAAVCKSFGNRGYRKVGVCEIFLGNFNYLVYDRISLGKISENARKGIE